MAVEREKTYPEKEAERAAEFRKGQKERLAALEKKNKAMAAEYQAEQAEKTALVQAWRDAPVNAKPAHPDDLPVTEIGPYSLYRQHETYEPTKDRYLITGPGVNSFVSYRMARDLAYGKLSMNQFVNGMAGYAPTTF